MAKQAQDVDLAKWATSGRHIVLIRDPARLIASFAQKESEGIHTTTSLEEIGVVELLQVHANLRAVLAAAGAPPPIVVDADALLAAPEKVLGMLCAELGISFDKAMLSWPKGPKGCDGIWAPHWYASAHASTGWEAGSRKLPPLLPPNLLPLLRDAEPFYSALLPLALRAPPDGLTVGPSTILARDSPDVIAKMPDPKNKDILVWVGPPGTGRLVPRELARISPFDSAVQGGDAVWEGVRVYDGKVFQFKRHMKRLFDSAKACGFRNVPSEDEIRYAVFSTLAANGMRDNAHMRLTLTRGEKTTSSMNPNFNVFGCTLIVLAEWKPVVNITTYDNSKGVKLITASQRRNSPSCLDSKIHHNNLLNNILPKIQANNAGAADAIMLDLDGFVAETNACNIFCVRNARVLTPFADACLPGITRENVLMLCGELGLPAEERRLSLLEFQTADEVFTTGTMGALTPVVEIDGRIVGDGVPGVITAKLTAAYKTLVDRPGMAEVLPDFPAASL
jgi:branched-chain amino acid aminotransferase group I